MAGTDDYALPRRDLTTRSAAYMVGGLRRARGRAAATICCARTIVAADVGIRSAGRARERIAGNEVAAVSMPEHQCGLDDV